MVMYKYTCNSMAGFMMSYTVPFEHQNMLVDKVLVVLDLRLVHENEIVPHFGRSSFVEIEVLRLECKHVFLWPLFRLDEPNGWQRVRYPPMQIHKTSKCKHCVLWDTSRSRP